MSYDINLDFKGPFSIKNLIEENDYEGIYLWCVKQKRTDQYLIHYIGESTKVIRRQSEHLTEVLGLNYGIFDSKLIQSGKLKFIWKGMWRDKSPERIINRLKAYPKVSSSVTKYIDQISLFIAKTDIDTNLRRHCEGMIGYHLRNHQSDFKKIYPDDNRVLLRKNIENVTLHITSDEDILGLDRTISF